MNDVDNTEQQKKFIIYYEIAKRCLLIIDQLYEDLVDSCGKLAMSDPQDDKGKVIARAFMAAHGLVDYYHRFYQLVDALPLISKKRKFIRKLKDDLEPAKKCRNYLQHIRNELSDSSSIDFPTFGALSWVEGSRNYILHPGQATKKVSSSGIAFDSKNGKFRAKYQVLIGENEVWLDHIYSELKLFWLNLNGSIDIRPRKIKEYRWGEHISLSITLEPADSN